MQEIRNLIKQVAPTETTVLIQGESGTGKELVARAIHKCSQRVNGPMIILNCAAVPSELIESELFGHKKGSFTGAIRDHEGVFRSAHGGTLFLDEIEATSPAMQVKLLRAIQTGEIKPVGDNITAQVDVRLIAATNQDLLTEIEKGNFREDLYYRINVFPIMISPLRERKDDIPILVNHFLNLVSQRSGKAVRGIDPAALGLLSSYPWPGNIRELENEIERAHVLTSDNSNLSVGSLSRRISMTIDSPAKNNPELTAKTLKEAVEQVEERMIAEALDANNGNRSLVAKRLGLSRQGLLNKMYKFGLSDR
jgi:transcriptional regulator with PAS, ATPase and Fis domain